jgi:hypothetical protein
MDKAGILWFNSRAMNTSFVNSVPRGEFAEISVLMSGWQNRFDSLVAEHRPIKFDFYPMPGLPSQIQVSLTKRGYSDVVMQKDQWQHFFIPEPHQNS